MRLIVLVHAIVKVWAQLTEQEKDAKAAGDQATICGKDAEDMLSALGATPGKQMLPASPSSGSGVLRLTVSPM